MGIAILNMGGVRKEEIFFGELMSHYIRLPGQNDADDVWTALRRELVRASLPAEEVLPVVVDAIRDSQPRGGH